jgi:hypothetical protein
MAISFTRAPTVASGDKITSAQYRALARAFNDRIRSGVGDPVFRVCWYMLQAARQIRNSDGALAFPSNAEFFEFYQHIDPTDGEWPLAGPGETEGTNVASVLGEFVFGSEGRDLYSEAERTTDPAAGGIDMLAPTSNVERWIVGKLQRGAYDAATGALASPSFKAAREHFRIVNASVSPHGNAFGGFLPVPEYLGNCTSTMGDPGSTEPFPSYALKFTPTDAGEALGYTVQTYGTCPENSGDVAWIYYGADRYTVVTYGGTTTEYLYRYWVEGPYTGGRRLRKTWGQHLPRILNHYAAEFRGTEAQRLGASGQPKSPNRYAFDIQRFLTSQYKLAPARGSDQSHGVVDGLYPLWWNASPVSGQTLSPYANDAGTPHAGFVYTAAYIEASNMTGTAEVDVRVDGVTVASLVVSEADSGAIHQFTAPITPGQAVSFVVRRVGAFSGGGGIFAECAELVEYKPELHDLYLVLRCASSRTDLEGGADGRGIDETQAKEIGDAYFQSGYISGVNGSGLLTPAAQINSNAIVDSFRRMSKNVRILGRDQFVGYAVENGKSVFWFKKNVRGLSYTNAFDGIADSIAHTAPAGGVTNEWVMDFQFKAYANATSSIWKADAHADYWAFTDRCSWHPRTYAPTLPKQASIHYAFGQFTWTTAEVPSGHRYATFPDEATALNTSATADFYSSCRIYEPPVEIESAETVTEGGVELVKVTMTGRVHSHPSAPSSIDRDVSTWTVATVQAEGYRTTENALREYLIHQNVGNNCVDGATQPGNAAANSDVWTSYTVFGSCFPHFLLTKLIPEPYEDGNETNQAHDSPFYHDPFPQMELYIRAMCEGYVDATTTTDYGCTSGIYAVIDYTFENLCFDAFGGRWINTLGQQPVSIAGAHREDNPQGFGPLPNTYAFSEVFNQFSSCINKMTRARIMLPIDWETQTVTGEHIVEQAQLPDGDGTLYGCSSTPSPGVFRSGVAFDAQADTISTAWASTGGTLAASSAYTFTIKGSGTVDCAGSGAFQIQAFRSEDQYRYAFVGDAANALPPTISDMISSNGELLGETTYVTTFRGYVEGVGAGDAEDCDGTSPWQTTAAPNYLRFPTITETTTECGLLAQEGQLTAPPLSRCVIAAASNGVGGACIIAGTSTAALTGIQTDALVLSVPLEDLEE